MLRPSLRQPRGVGSPSGLWGGRGGVSPAINPWRDPTEGKAVKINTKKTEFPLSKETLRQGTMDAAPEVAVFFVEKKKKKKCFHTDS